MESKIEESLPPVEFVRIQERVDSMRKLNNYLAPHPINPPFGEPFNEEIFLDDKRYMIRWDGEEMQLNQIDKQTPHVMGGFIWLFLSLPLTILLIWALYFLVKVAKALTGWDK